MTRRAPEWRTGRAGAGAVEIVYEVSGDPRGIPLLLVAGLGVQLIGWHDDLCAELVRRGYLVVRFDNRDVGLSTHLHEAGEPDLAAIAAAEAAGRRPDVPYTLDDMADDAAGLLDHLGIGSAHVLGESLGGMIAQTLAVRHPARVRSLTSLSSTTGDPAVGRATPEATAELFRARAHDREQYADRLESFFRVIGSTAYPLDVAFFRDRGRRSWDRGHEAAGVVRQIAAIRASGDRTAQLRTIGVPTLVFHGRDDALIAVSGGEATAAAVPGARLVVVDGLGHDLPREVWPRLLDELDAVVREGERRRR